MKSNPRVSVMYWQGREGYQLKGTVTIETTGKRFEETARWIEELSQKAGFPLKSKGAIIVQIEEIIQLEKTAKSLKKKYFGVEGELFKKREELIKPIQEDIYEAIKQLATEGNYAVVFDAAGGASLLYTNEKYDKSDEILKKLGY